MYKTYSIKYVLQNKSDICPTTPFITGNRNQNMRMCGGYFGHIAGKFFSVFVKSYKLFVTFSLLARQFYRNLKELIRLLHSIK